MEKANNIDKKVVSDFGKGNEIREMHKILFGEI
jgi:hypothetical protein